jgi:regulator of protease activity HflC (stomatin/prohibitin superfamily)|tara:strand:- start:417 stop:1361 length:945 start_codon:yes stop_codon:yes gene_type:complete
MSPFLFIVVGLTGILGAWMFSCIVVVGPREGRIVQVFGGKVSKVLTTQGIHFKLPAPINTVSRKITLSQFEVSEMLQSVRTSNDSIVGLNITAFIERVPEDLAESYFALDDAESQFRNIMAEAAKEKVPDLTLNDLFKDRATIQDHVKSRLNEYFAEYGFRFKKITVDDPILDEDTKDSMNAVYRAELDLVAARKNREAIKEREIGEAEAAAESLKKRSEASVEVRENNVASLAQAVKKFKEEAPGVDINYLFRTLEGVDMRDAIVSASGKEGNMVVVATGNNDHSGSQDANLIGQMAPLVKSEVSRQMAAQKE